MPGGPHGRRRPGAVFGAAVHVVKIATGEIAETGCTRPAERKGGVAGAAARNESLAPERRREIARAAAAARRSG